MSDAGQFKPVTPMLREMVLANVDYFFSTQVGKEWGDISLLKAGKLNHRLISRIRNGEGFQTNSVDKLFDTMNRALRGELNPEEYRNYRAEKPAAAPSGVKARAKDARHASYRRSRHINFRAGDRP